MPSYPFNIEVVYPVHTTPNNVDGMASSKDGELFPNDTVAGVSIPLDVKINIALVITKLFPHN